jgi:hypothetical protein
MATVVNNAGQPTGDSSGSGMGLLVGALLVLGIILLVIFYGLPALRQTTTSVAPAAPSTTEVNIPDQSDIQVPDQIDVNVQTPEGQ